MYRSDPKKALRSVRLYPRLATTNPAGPTVNRRERRIGRTAATVNDPIETNPATTARAEVRARLLRMILDNEQIRRNVQRPGPT